MLSLLSSKFAPKNKRADRRKLIKNILKLIFEYEKTNGSFDNENFLQLLKSLSDDNLRILFSLLARNSGKTSEILSEKVELVNRTATQYTCITIDPKKYAKNQPKSGKLDVLNCLRKSKESSKATKSDHQELSGIDSCELLKRILNWLAVILHNFNRSAMTPDTIFKPNPLCVAQNSRHPGGTLCCGEQGGEREAEHVTVERKGSGARGRGRGSVGANGGSNNHISNICFNPHHWSILHHTTIHHNRTHSTSTSEHTNTSCSEKDKSELRGGSSSIVLERGPGVRGGQEYDGPVPYPNIDHSMATMDNDNESSIPFKRWCYYKHDPSSSQSNRDSPWVKIAFWEKRNRVGPLQTVHKNNVIIACSRQFTPEVSEPTSETCERLILDEIKTQSGPNPNEFRPITSRPETKPINYHQIITSGVVLSHCNDGEIWLFNQDERPVFVHSATMTFDPSCAERQSVIIRLEPGTCARIFNPETFPFYRKATQNQPIDPYSIKISFAKGFGPGYTRTQISSCPLWCEVLLNIDRSV